MRHVNIKFCIKLEKSANKTFEHSLSRAQVLRGHKSILEGREQVDNEHRLGMPSILLYV